MSIVSKLASQQGRNDDEPNKELGKALVAQHDVGGIRDIAAHLSDADKRIEADCLSVLEQVGRLAPELIADYVSNFLQLVQSKNNRLVWATMIDLALIADRKPQEIFERYDDIVQVMVDGSVITQDNGIKILARVASTSTEYHKTIWPFLLEQLSSCRAKSVPQYAESISVAVNPECQDQYQDILKKRYETLSTAQRKRVKKLLEKL